MKYLLSLLLWTSRALTHDVIDFSNIEFKNPCSSILSQIIARNFGPSIPKINRYLMENAPWLAKDGPLTEIEAQILSRISKNEFYENRLFSKIIEPFIFKRLLLEELEDYRGPRKLFDEYLKRKLQWSKGKNRKGILESLRYPLIGGYWNELKAKGWRIVFDFHLPLRSPLLYRPTIEKTGYLSYLESVPLPLAVSSIIINARIYSLQLQYKDVLTTWLKTKLIERDVNRLGKPEKDLGGRASAAVVFLARREVALQVAQFYETFIPSHPLYRSASYESYLRMNGFDVEEASAFVINRSLELIGIHHPIIDEEAASDIIHLGLNRLTFDQIISLATKAKSFDH